MKGTKRVLQGDLICDLKLKQDARLVISRPKGLVVRKLSRDLFEEKLVLAVGDAVFKNLLEIGIKPNLCVLDLKVQRQRIEEPKEALKGYTILRTKNPPGWITMEAWLTIKKAINAMNTGQKVAVLVEGEEDLLGFPVAIIGPLDSLFVYGQPGEGAVIVHLTKQEKARAIRILEESFECAND